MRSHAPWRDGASPPVPDPPTERDDPSSERKLVEELTRQLTRASATEFELRRLLRDTHDQLAERDRLIEELMAGRRPWEQELAGLYSDRATVAHERDVARAQMEALRGTRAWRMVVRYWRIKTGLLGH